jgi:DNA (cytosine-5)-methyltransferase 1
VPTPDRRRDQKRSGDTPSPKFIDLFAGCGGLSLGLLMAGWDGIFAIEKNKDAFNTLSTNLIDKRKPSFSWPEWLPQKACTTAKLLSQYEDQLKQLKGKIDLVAGAPPCQGFSLAGRRIYTDPRNSLFRQYLAVVKMLEPRFILLENVQGFDFPFVKNGTGIERKRPYSQILKKKLETLGYIVFPDFIDFSDFGVPQHRCRFILIAIRKDDPAALKLKEGSPFDILKSYRRRFLSSKRLPADRPVSCKEAIKDLETKGRQLVPSPQERIRAFVQLEYKTPNSTTAYACLMRKKAATAPNSQQLSPSDIGLTVYVSKSAEAVNLAGLGQALSREIGDVKVSIEATREP